MKKRIIISTFFLIAGFSLAGAETFFSGETGIAANFINESSRSFDPTLELNGFFAGQLTVSNALSFRGEFSLRTSDLYENGFTKEADSIFRITELSGTFTKSFAGATHTVSLFLGNFETVGSQQFIMRHLGVQNYSSKITENYLGQNGAVVYPIFGIGGAYSLTLKNIPLSTGLVIAKNDENFEDVAQINADFRLATAFRNFTMDLVAGIGAPLYTKNSNDEDVFLLIDTIYFHAGVDVLLGNKYETFSLFIQNGFEYLPIKSTSKSKEFDFADMYLLVEPRFNFGDLKIYFTLFSLPDEKIGKLIFIDDTLGLNFSFFADKLHTEKRNYTLGLNLMTTFEGKHFNDFEDADLTDYLNIKLIPFGEVDIADGKLKIALQTSVIKFAKNNPNAIKLNIGYKKEL